MKRLLVVISLIATVAMAVEPTGLRLPWNTAKKIQGYLSSDSIWTDTSFFKHDRESDSAYSVYFALGEGDSLRVTLINGNGDKVTVTDTLLASKLYKLVVHAESLVPTTGFVTRLNVADSTWNDTFFFKHGRKDDSVYDLWALLVDCDTVKSAVFIGDTVRVAQVNGPVDKITIEDTLLASLPYKLVVDADSALMTKYYIDNADTQSFKHAQETDSLSNLYAANIYADTLFIKNLMSDSWGLKAGVYVTLTWSDDTGTIGVDTANVHSWGDGLWLDSAYIDTVRMLRDTANAALAAADNAQDTATLARDTANQALADASNAQDTATLARDTANQALADASNAQDTATLARDTANQALADAAQAQDTANAALAAAENAQDTATLARDTANQALADAAKAQDTANVALAKDSLGKALWADSARIADGSHLLQGQDTTFLWPHAALADSCAAWSDSLGPTVVAATRLRGSLIGGTVTFAAGAPIEVDSATIAADSSILYIWVNTKRYAMLLSNP